MKNKIFKQLKEKAFTLAETLIVIGVIGVVAALTLPNLNSSTGDKEKVAKVKKIYSNLTEAVDRAQSVYGPYDEWFKDLTSSSTLTDTQYSKRAELTANRILEFMKVSKVCGNNSGCFSSKPLLNIDDSEYVENRDEDLIGEKAYTAVLSDGTAIAFGSGKHGNNSAIYVDIDGAQKGKNQIGNDSFTFIIDLDNVLKPLANNSTMSGAAKFSYTGGDTGYDSYIWAIYNNNMDYLKCPSELNWDTQTSCK